MTPPRIPDATIAELLAALKELRRWTGWVLHPEGCDTPLKRGCVCASAYDVEKMVDSAISRAESLGTHAQKEGK